MREFSLDKGRAFENDQVISPLVGELVPKGGCKPIRLIYDIACFSKNRDFVSRMTKTDRVNRTFNFKSL